MDRYPITSDFRLPRPLLEEDQLILDAIEQVKPGASGKDTSNFIERLVPRRPAGTFGEVIVAAALNSEGKQDFACLDVLPSGLLVSIDTRESISKRDKIITGRRVTYSGVTSPISTPASREIKQEAVRRIRLANELARD